MTVVARRLLPSGKASFCSRYSGNRPDIVIFVGLFGGTVIAEVYCCRMVFLVFGIPGVLLAALIRLMVKEPPKLKVSSDVVDHGL